MKIFYILFGLLTTVSFSQIPPNYYDNATGMGYILKSQLNTIITNGHIDRGYGSGSATVNNGLWEAYKTTDRDVYYENDNTVLDMYSEKPSLSDPYNYTYSTSQCSGSTSPSAEGGCYNREHLVPQSYFDNVTTSYIRNDPHFVVPADIKVNAWRNDYSIGRVNDPVSNQCTNSTASPTALNSNPCVSLNGSKLGKANDSGYSMGFSGIVFEPIDEFKGDIARMILYFVTRYETQLGAFYTNTTSDAKAMFDGSSDKSFSSTFLKIFLTWNAQDPVSPRETARNNAIYTFQGNRNPYIDHPEYVTSIWGAVAGIEEIEYQNTKYVEVYPTVPKDNKVFVKQINQAKIILVLLYNEQGQLLGEYKNTNNQEIIELNLPSKKGVYFIKALGKGIEVNRQVIVK